MKLTRAKNKLMDFLKAYRVREGEYPTYQVICEALDIKSRSTIHFHVEELTRWGHIKKHADGAISDVIDFPLPKPSGMGKIRLPMAGSIAASPAREAYEQSDIIEVPDTFLGRGADLFALKVMGPSMTDAGIQDGDLVFIRRQNTARSGQIVAALINGETTLKRFVKRKGGVFLVPSHPEMNDIPISPEDDFSILGVLEGYFHRMEG